MNKIQITLSALLISSVSLLGCASTIVAADDSNTTSPPQANHGSTTAAQRTTGQLNQTETVQGTEAKSNIKPIQTEVKGQNFEHAEKAEIR